MEGKDKEEILKQGHLGDTEREVKGKRKVGVGAMDGITSGKTQKTNISVSWQEEGGQGKACRSPQVRRRGGHFAVCVCVCVCISIKLAQPILTSIQTHVMCALPLSC